MKIKTLLIILTLTLIAFLSACENTAHEPIVNNNNEIICDTKVSQITYYDKNTYYQSTITYIYNETQISQSTYEKYEIKNTISELNIKLSDYESESDAINQYKTQINNYKVYFMGGNCYLQTVTGYKITSYSIKLYNNNYALITETTKTYEITESGETWNESNKTYGIYSTFLKIEFYE